MKAWLAKWPAPRSGVLVLLALIACGDNLVHDPSFDLWCGDALCAPWQAQGKVSRAGTWHAHDYGASLADRSVLSQLSEHDAVDCIELEVIADVDASASVYLEMDFQDDGVTEYSQLVPESHWARLRYVVNTPDWYDRVRFILRKQGSGRAVVAQIKATSSEDCDGPELPLRDQPAGAFCDAAQQCESALCEPAPVHYASATELTSELTPDSLDEHHACSVCSADTGCAAGEVCDVAVTLDVTMKEHAARACQPAGDKALGAWCMSGAACETGLCAQALPLEHGTCSACLEDTDCKPGEVCGLAAFDDGPARSCHAPEQRVLGAACASGQDCASGVCCEGSCSECCKDAPCAGDASCEAHPLFVTTSPFLCAAGTASREAGRACIDDTDCRSGSCKLDGAQCFVADTDCGFLRQLAGVCR